MDRDALASRLMKLFLTELEEHERTLERDLLALEREPSERRPELIESLFRAAHSLKGAARAAQARSVETLCHRLEQSLSDLRGPAAPIAAERMQALLVQVDGLKEAAELLRRQEEQSKAPPLHSPPERHSVVHESTPRHAAGSSDAEKRPARVDMHKLDMLLANSGDLVVASARIEARLAQLDVIREETQRVAESFRHGVGDGSSLVESVCGLERLLDALQNNLRRDGRAIVGATRRVDDQVRRLRMVAFREACEGLERSVRDLARTLQKEVRLQIAGDQLEIDRELVQRLRDLLLHLVRNAVSHGIERPGERAASGKPAEATVLVQAQLRGPLVDVSVQDDGRGLELAAIRAKARSLGLPEAADDEELAAYVFTQGLTTAPTVSEIAGRGVGLDAVKRGAEALHGAVRVRSTPGRGARFTLRIPVTLSKLRCLFVSMHGTHYALPTAHVASVLQFHPEQLLRIGGSEFVRAGAELVPLLPLAGLLGLAVRQESDDDRLARAIVISVTGRSVALVTSELLDEREVVVNKLPPRLAGATFVSGATLLPNGRIALILHGAELAQAALANLPRTTAPLFAPTLGAPRRVLVVDDSITTRALIKSILEEAGYHVTAARDGAEAFRLLSEQTFELVVSDVQMPHMDGFALTAAIRHSAMLARLPVILVTSREGESDRLRGLEVGANAYLGKSAFDHRVLLEVVGGLL